MFVAILKTLRPHQWTKNLVVLAALVFSLNFGDAGLARVAFEAVGVFCLLSGAVYLLNDLKDREKDRLHPIKRQRPIASGALPVPVALLAFVVVLAAGLAAAALLGPRFLAVSTAYLALNLAYSFVLRSKMLLDVMAIAAGFVLRALAGTEVLVDAGADVRISPWLLMCAFFLSLVLALGKRRHELGAAEDGHRKSLRGYSVALVDRLTTLAVGVTLVSYSIYSIWPETVEKFGTENLIYTIPFVFYGLARYLYLVTERDGGGDPSEMLITDRGILITVVLWFLVIVAILYWPW
ncbi:decaprenyl-phosphate phosphoribosyltransferase [bacterium]|nr:MAG: decaprenyl-phosphate phosphoribosyltransferase [bacterium]RKZ17184.1 MAG: decaprenyl-phosphate phosphoribosyltransferase [bacterium]